MIYTEYLSTEHSDMVARFRSSKHPHTEELTNFLQEDALREQDERISTTTLFFVDDSKEIDAFVTLSASALKTPPSLQESLPDRRYVPVVIMDYLAERGFGYKVFEWVLNEVVRRAESIGIRAILLEVRAGNWHAYRQYSRRWGFRALPLRGYKGDPACDAPDANGERPENVKPERLIPMYFDLAEHFGAVASESEE
jgi:hypothetical protein